MLKSQTHKFIHPNGGATLLPRSPALRWYLLGVVLAAAVLSTAAQSKVQREAADMADKRQYVDAVRTLELAMLDGDTSETLLFDLAEYYRKVGNLRMATSLWKPLVDKAQPRPWHLLEVSSMLIEQGRFTDAEPYLRRFEELKPKDPRAERLREKARAHRTIVPRYPNARLDTFVHNTPADDGFPVVDEGGRIMWSAERAGAKRTSGWTGRPMVGLYTAKEELGEPGNFGPAKRIDESFNRGRRNVASPCLSANGDTLYFSSNAEELNNAGEHNMQLFYAGRRAEDGNIGRPYRVPHQPSNANCLHPCLSADGRWLYYAADAGDSEGGLDLYRIAVRPDGSWGQPQNLGNTVNTERHDAFPVAAKDGSLYFASKGHTGMGGFDLFVTRELPSGEWSPPMNLGEPVNSKFDETNWVPVSKRFGYLVSNRVGGDDDIYEVRW